jgi:D-alanine-D-alanine ligase
VREQPLVWRDEVTPEDRESVRRLCEVSGFFSAEEVEIAVELVEERLAKGVASGYRFLFAQQGDTILGFACYGPISGTESSWDLYWIAVEEKERGQGLGRKLQGEVERRTALFGGRRLYAWTSSRNQYLRTRKFYERLGYSREAILRDYYKPGEHLVIYVKHLPGPSTPPEIH